ncbi:MAG TPA: SRPBCC domain-containing protein [Flavobacterium sp.]|uniref:SRPBCC family protein n=1 Tax=Flavobacterium sp. TaxID=239 RepID=UPI002B7E0712|nr:SRPBCC domain-containing protein [Flavobacterium sp.]HSD14012.1 SRPBCC domain-containing protein [Flavobacterium sp.]
MSHHNLYIDNKLVISRDFKAPKNLVYKAWSEAERFEQWWGPSGFSTNVITFDFRQQGTCHYCIESPDSLKMWGRFIYKEILPNKKIEFLNCFSDENAGVIRAPFSESWPLEMFNIMTLEEENGITTVTLLIAPYNASDMEIKTFGENHENMELGFKGTFDRLEDYLLKN